MTEKEMNRGLLEELGQFRMDETLRMKNDQALMAQYDHEPRKAFIMLYPAISQFLHQSAGTPRD